MTIQNPLASRIDIKSIYISCLISLLIALYFISTSQQFEHWFLIPVTLCGIVIGVDAVEWFRRRLDLFDPVGIIGLLGYHFFFLAPLLHVNWDVWYVTSFIYPTDWRPWLGSLSIFNLIGIFLYRISRNIIPISKNNYLKKSVWLINPNRFFPIITFAMVISLVLQTMVYSRFGGVLGYIASATSGDESAFEGMGILFLFSESFPILAMMAFGVYAQKYKRLNSWPILLIILVIFLALQMFFGGFRGSRSNTIWALFWAVGIIHFMIRQVTRKQIAVGLVFLLFFMYFYGFFKADGIDGVKTAFSGRDARTQLEAESGRTWQGLLLGDLARSDIQASTLRNLMRPDSDYEYAFGETYLAATTLMVPSFMMPDTPFKHKIMKGTEMLYGKDSFQEGVWESSKVYGLAGEAMLNFGPFALPLAFIPFGILVGFIQRKLFEWDALDSRMILMPMLVNLAFIVLVSDLDNVIFFMFKNSGLPVLVIFLSSRQIRMSAKPKNFVNSLTH